MRLGMLITNISEYMLDSDNNLIIDWGFHIPNHPNYKELAFPYYFRDENLVIVDKNGDLAIFTYEMLNSFDWEVFTD